MSIKLKGNNESTFAQNIKTAKQVEVSDGIKFGDGTVQTTAATGGGGGGDSTGSGADAWGTVNADGTLAAGLNVSVTKGGIGNYEVTFNTPMPSADYSVVGSVNQTPMLTFVAFSKTANGFTYVMTDGSINVDSVSAFAVFASNAIAPQAGVGADAWGNVKADGTLNAGFNVGNVVRNSQGDYTIRLTENIPTQYAVTVGGDALSIKVPSISDNEFRIQTFNSAGEMNDYKFTFAAFGSSTVTPTFTWTRDGTTLKPANDGDDVYATNKAYFADYSNNSGARFSNAGTLTLRKAESASQIIGELNGTETFNLDSNGSITTAGSITTDGQLLVSNFNVSSDSTRGLRVREVDSKAFTTEIQAHSGVTTSQKAISVYKGKTQVWSVQYNGNATFNNAIFNLEPDNSANYVSTTNAEGETESVYNGPVLDVKDRLQKSDAALTAIKAAVSDSNTDLAGLKAAILAALSNH